MIEVRVYSTPLDWSNNHSALTRRIEFTDSLHVDYDSMIRVFKSLFGKDCVVVFVCF